METNNKMHVMFKKDSITHELLMYICIVQKIFEISLTNYNNMSIKTYSFSCCVVENLKNMAKVFKLTTDYEQNV